MQASDSHPVLVESLKQQTLVYLDHAASTPLREEAAAAWIAAQQQVGNAASVHAHGRAATSLVESARERLAATLGAHPTEVTFTAGGTEAINLAIQGLWRAGVKRGRDTIVVSAAEHHATLDAAQAMVEAGANLVKVPVDAVGRVRQLELREVLAAHRGRVAAVGVLWVNNEVGTLERIAEVAEAARAADAPLHLDAVAAIGRTPVDFAASGAVALSIAGHKIGAPAGTGALLVRRGTQLEPLLHGGGQQQLRSGTVDAAGAVALAVAVELAVRELSERSRRLQRLEERLRNGLAQAVPDAVPSGDRSPGGSVPGIVHVTIPGVDGESLVLLLDRAGCSVSMGSACRAGVAETSHVLLAMGLDERTARGSLRLSLGSDSSETDVDRVIAAVATAVPVARRASGWQMD